MQNKSHHILSTSSTLLGFVFFVLVSIKGLGIPDGSLIDKATALMILIFAGSSLMSFLSLRVDGRSLRAERYETAADYMFLCGLFIMTVVSLFLAADMIFLVK